MLSHFTKNIIDLGNEKTQDFFLCIIKPKSSLINTIIIKNQLKIT